MINSYLTRENIYSFNAMNICRGNQLMLLIQMVKSKHKHNSELLGLPVLPSALPCLIITLL